MSVPVSAMAANAPVTPTASWEFAARGSSASPAPFQSRSSSCGQTQPASGKSLDFK